MDFKYRKYRDSDREEVIELLSNLWSFPKEEKIKYFDWKLVNNPYTDEVCGFVALHEGKIVAFRGYFVLPFQDSKEKYLLAQLCDTVTHRDYYRKGLFKNLTKYSIESLERDGKYLASQNSSSGGPTLNGYLSLGWKPLSDRSNLFKFNLKGISNKLLKISNSFKPKVFAYQNKTLIFTDEVRAEDIVSIPFEYERISHSRDKDFYEWRLSNPHSKYCFAYLYDQNEKLRAYIIFWDLGDNRYDIIDFNCYDKRDLKLLLNQFSKKEHPLFLLLWAVDKENLIYKNLRFFGFKKMEKLNNSKKFVKQPFLIRKLMEGKDDIIFEPSNWNIFKIVADEV